MRSRRGRWRSSPEVSTAVRDNAIKAAKDARAASIAADDAAARADKAAGMADGSSTKSPVSNIADKMKQGDSSCLLIPILRTVN